MPRYTCNDYRQEMRLIGLKKQLQNENLSETQRQQVAVEIEKLEQEMQMD